VAIAVVRSSNHHRQEEDEAVSNNRLEDIQLSFIIFITNASLVGVDGTTNGCGRVAN